ncbi:MAG: hypothetical protein ABSG43_27675 [Solirubrobacteraceae bacterium]
MQADVERAGGRGFALGALAPGVERVCFAGERGEDRADGSVPGPDTLASRLPESRVFTLRALAPAPLSKSLLSVWVNGVGD